jgi:hypothetical protein
MPPGSRRLDGALTALGSALTQRYLLYNPCMDFLYAALIFVFMVAVLVVLWKREHPKKN